MQTLPKISIITVTYNSAATLKDTIESVKKQDYKNIEYIIVDGASKDNTVDIIKSYAEIYPIKWISEPDKGLYDAMNKGFEMASGEILGLVNSDDLFCNDRALTMVAEEFKLNSDLDSVYADLYYVKGNDISNIVRHWKTGAQRSFQYGWHPAHPTFYVKKTIYDKYGYFDISFKLAADFELMLRLLERHRISAKYLKEPLIKMRLGGVTNKSIKNIISQNRECIKAFHYNHLKVSPFYPIFRLFPKIKQYFKLQ